MVLNEPKLLADATIPRSVQKAKLIRSQKYFGVKKLTKQSVSRFWRARSKNTDSALTHSILM